MAKKESGKQKELPSRSTEGRTNSTTTPMNRGLSAAKAAKQDEFYTQYADIQREIDAYLEFDPDTFRAKVVYCNCDDPFESNFFKYFAANFNKLGLKKLIATSYDGSPIAGQGTLFPEYNLGSSKRLKPKAVAVVLDHVKDEDGDGAANVTDVELFLKRNKAARIALKGNDEYPGGDFRSPECVAFLKQADIVVTNPPFSLLREYVGQLMEHGKKFLIVGPKNATTYKEIFPLIKRTKLWLGSGFANGNAYFSIPIHGGRAFADGVYDESTGLVKFRNVCWFTNLDHGRRHQRLPLMTIAENLKFSKHKELRGKPAYDRYDNYDAIEVPFTDSIPSEYDGVMGVPVTFLDKFNPDQFEILGYEKSYELQTKQYGTHVQVDTAGKRSNVSKLNDGAAIKVDQPPTDKTYYIVDGAYYIQQYKRIFIRHRRSKKGKKK